MSLSSANSLLQHTHNFLQFSVLTIIKEQLDLARRFVSGDNIKLSASDLQHGNGRQWQAMATTNICGKALGPGHQPRAENLPTS